MTELNEEDKKIIEETKNDAKNAGSEATPTDQKTDEKLTPEGELLQKLSDREQELAEKEAYIKKREEDLNALQKRLNMGGETISAPKVEDTRTDEEKHKEDINNRLAGTGLSV